MRAQIINGLLHLSAKLPLRLNRALGTIIGRILLVINNEQRKIAATNLEKCFPTITTEERASLLRETLIEIGKTFTESGTLWFGTQDNFFKSIKDVHGEQHFKAGLEKGKGVILALPHLGSWEALSLYCSFYYPTTSLYRPPRLTGLDDAIRNARQRFGAKLVPTNAKGVRALYQALANNEVVVVLPDQDPRENGGHFAPFFGIQANTMTLLSRLAQKTGAQVLCTYAERLPGGQGFVLHFDPVSEDIHNKEMATSIKALNQSVEKSIRQHPAQYQWGYKRFRTRPEGEDDFYRDN